MPSPFPGMDPFLEQPRFWPGVHEGFIADAMTELNRRLPNGYAACIDERVSIVPTSSQIVPAVR